jgi:hypothetical protein
MTVLDAEAAGEEKTLSAFSHILLACVRQLEGDTTVTPLRGSRTCKGFSSRGGGPVGVSDSGTLPDGQVSARRSPRPASEACCGQVSG